MVPSKTYLKFKETRSQEDLETLNKYLNRLNEISSKLNDDALELSAEEENKLYDEDEDLTDKVLRLLFGDTFFIFISEYSLDGYDSWEDTVEDLMEILNQMDLLRGCDDQYFDYNVDEVDMVLYGATINPGTGKIQTSYHAKIPILQG